MAETCYFEVLISFHLECSRLIFLSTYYGNVEPAPSGCTHELSLLLVLGLAQFRWLELSIATTCYYELFISSLASYLSGYLLVYFGGS